MPNYAIQGFVPAVVTPFSKTGEFMPDAFAEILEWHLSWGATGFLVGGDNGEQWALTEKDLTAVTRAAMKAVKGRVPVYVGCTAVSNPELLARARAVAEGGATGLAITQAYVILNATTAEICHRFENVAKNVKLPIMLFNTIQRAGYTITHDMTDALLNVAPIVAVKQSNPNWAFAQEAIRRFRDRIAVFIGNGTNLVSGRLMGSAGFISTGPDLLGDDIQKILNPDKLNVTERLELSARVKLVFETMLASVPGAPAGWPGPSTDPAPYKAALNMIGLPAGYPRDPIMPATPEVEANIRQALDKLGVLDREKLRRGRTKAAE